jgi:hypothetical protein
MMWTQISARGGPGHEISWPVQTLGSWVKIPLEAWMSVFVWSCVGSDLAAG